MTVIKRGRGFITFFNQLVMEDYYQKITSGVRKNKKKHALFLCGTAGAGKTSMRSKFLNDVNMTSSYVYLNIDEIRPIVGSQEKARDAFVEIVTKVIEDGYSFLHDSTCRDKSVLLERMKLVKQKGYTVKVGIVYASLDTVLERVSKRVDQPLTEDQVRDIYRHLTRNVEVYMTSKFIDEIYLYNNDNTSTLLFHRDRKEIHCKNSTMKFYFDVSKYC
jgi:predicted ABC-type ATPase